MLAEGGVVCAGRVEGPAVDIIGARHDPLVNALLARIGSWFFLRAQWRERPLTKQVSRFVGTRWGAWRVVAPLQPWCPPDPPH